MACLHDSTGNEDGEVQVGPTAACRLETSTAKNSMMAKSFVLRSVPGVTSVPFPKRNFIIGRRFFFIMLFLGKRNVQRT